MNEIIREFEEYLESRIAAKEREMAETPKLSSHYDRLDHVLIELKGLRAKLLMLTRRGAA